MNTTILGLDPKSGTVCQEAIPKKKSDQIIERPHF